MHESEVSEIVTHTIDMMNALSVRQFSLPPNTYIGAGAIARTGEAIEKCGVHRVLVITDALLEKLGLPQGMYRALRYSNIEYSVFCMPMGEPKSEDVEAAARQAAESGCGAIVAFGGGSALDAAKAVALLLANPGNSVSDLEDATHTSTHIKPRTMPLVAVPTTAGTGSEVTQYSILSDDKAQTKRAIASPLIFPKIALLDSKYQLALPRATASSSRRANCARLGSPVSASKWACCSRRSSCSTSWVTSTEMLTTLSGLPLDAGRGWAARRSQLNWPSARVICISSGVAWRSPRRARATGKSSIGQGPPDSVRQSRARAVQCRPAPRASGVGNWAWLAGLA